MLNQVFEGYPRQIALGVTLGFAVVAAWGVAEIAGRVVRIALARLAGDDLQQRAALERSTRVARTFVFLIFAALLAVPAVEVAGYSVAFGPHREQLAAWLFEEGLRIALVVLLAWLLLRVVGSAVVRLERQAVQGAGLDALERAKRIRTLGNLARNSVGAIVISAAALMILRELRVDIVPLLTGAGILGLAVGFGAQTLVKDVISGFFLILENHIRVGDVAVVNGTGGLVEAINLRTVVLRDIEGTVHVFPNGSITTLANRTKDYSYAVLDVTVAYNEDPDRVAAALTQVGDELTRDPVAGAGILEPLEVLGLESMGDAAITLRARMKTQPLKQFDVARELRRRTKRALEANGIEVPQRTLTVLGAPARTLAPRAPEAGQTSTEG